MSIEAKQLMLQNLEKEFNNTLSATTTDNILKTIADQLDLSSLEPIGESDLDIISNDMLDSFLTAKQLKGRSEKTLERYKYILSLNYQYLQKRLYDLLQFIIYVDF